MTMKRYVLIMFLLLPVYMISGQSYDYEPFFTVRVIDNEDTEFLFTDMRYFNADEELKYFFWIRRGTDLGTATYQIDFKKIKFLQFKSEYDKPIPGFTSADLTLTSGEVFPVLIKTTGKIGGMDNDFGIYGDIYMHYNIIKSIEFIHDGQFKNCPFCSAIFYNSDYIECPFDKTLLVEQHGNQAE